MSIRVNVDGMPGDEAARLISPLDQGFLFGASVYEAVRTYDGRPFLLERHLKRLRESAAALDIVFDTDDGELAKRIDDTLQAASNPESQIRIVVSAGVGRIDYGAGSTSKPTVVIVVRPLPDFPDTLYRDGADAVFVTIMRAAPGNLSPRIKSSNLLNNVMALRQAHARGAYEALMLNSAGEVAEGSMSNVFIAKGGAIRTPPLDAGILEGITRELVFEIANESRLELEEATFLPDELLAADEVFITASARQIVPIVRVDGVTIGGGRPGPLTRRLILLYRDKVRALMRPSSNPQGGS
ncbi:MAG TPA: aminotransferase class IV [Vicinamibacteria bacterium]|nr:aminotransferase class IV [Vicinamibacteria bacterium]